MTRYLAQLFGIPIVCSEINPYGLTGKPASFFLPCDPAWQGVNLDLVSHGDWLLEFKRRLIYLLEAAQSRGWQTIIIRDHLFSEYFAARSAEPPILLEMLNEIGFEVTSVFTVRHPLDSYLGLKNSFPSASQAIDLHFYSELYLQAFGQWQAAIPNLRIIRIEDLAAGNPCYVLAGLAEELGIVIDQSKPVRPLSHHLNPISGASGRYSDEPTLMKRRPLTNKTRETAISSKAFQKLATVLGYPDETDLLQKPSFRCRSRAISLLSLIQEKYPLMAKLLARLGIQRICA